MEYEFSASGQSLIVRLKGELDHHYAEILRARIEKELMTVRFKNVIFDFTGLSFMDSSGIGMVMGRRKTVEHLGGFIGLVCEEKTVTDRYGRSVPSGIERILEMSGVLKTIKRYATVEAALADIR